jgi:flagellar basal-body rod modification protein FlgD
MSSVTYDPGHILGRAERELYNQKTFTGSSEMDKEDFLTLLVTQLTNQDPLNPMNDQEFTAQLAEFSSLEQLTNINDNIVGMNEKSSAEDIVNAAAFIGKEVRAQGTSLSVKGDHTSSLYYYLQENAADVYVNVMDETGNIVRTVNFGSQAAGEHEFQWDGKDSGGQDVPDGVYQIYMAATGSNDQPILVHTEVSGQVNGVQNLGGTHYLRLSDGRVVNFMEVYEVVDTELTGSTADPDAGTDGNTNNNQNDSGNGSGTS